MAFLDNSGDIILDAVLTDLGREKMATGDFSVSYFALGDDEIDYSLYNKNHPSGSAYYDLEILQTPILEAFTGTNAAINGGLLTSTATDILYMPTLKINTKMNSSNSSVIIPDSVLARSGQIVWLTDSSNDNRSSTTVGDTLDSTTTKQIKYLNGAGTSKFLLVEDGLDTTVYKATSANTTSLLAGNSLLNSNYYIHYDNRFVDTIYGATLDSKFDNTSEGNAGTVSVTMASARSATFDLALENYSTARIPAPTNQVYYSPSNSTSDTDISEIAGPRGNFCAFTLSPKSDLGDKYSLFGNTATINDVACEYIDTNIYLEGTTTGATLQIPVRIVRLAIS